MYARPLLTALIGMFAALALASTNTKRAAPPPAAPAPAAPAPDDFITCLSICSGDNTECLDIAANNSVEVEGILYACELEAEYCQAVCGINELALIIVQDGLEGLDDIEKDAPTPAT